MPEAITALTVPELEDVLDELFEVEFSFRSTLEAAQSLATQTRADQDYVLDWVRRACGAQLEIGAQYAERVVHALDIMDKRVMEAWISDAMDAYDREGLATALRIIREVDDFVELSHERNAGAVLDDETGVLLHFVNGLSGRRMRIEQGDAAYTDTETLYLPHIVATLKTSDDNFKLYKAMVTYQWAQNRFGTFRVDLHKMLAQHDSPQAFLSLFHSLDTLRLEACIQRELPGLHREMQRMKADLGEDQLPADWHALAEKVSRPDTSIHEVCALVSQHLNILQPLSTKCFQGVLNPKQVADVTAARLLKEKARFRTVLREWTDELQEKNQDDKSTNKVGADDNEEGAKPLDAPQIDLASLDEDPDTSEMHIQLNVDGEMVEPPEAMQQLVTSIVQDLGEVPDDYLVPAGDGEYDPSLLFDEEQTADDVWGGTYHEIGAFMMPEWDFRRQTYRKNWCAVREMDVEPVYDNFVQDTLHKYSGLVKHLRNLFEAIRDEDKLLKRQSQGDNVDIDALIEALADHNAGMEMSDNVYTRMHRSDRNIAVCFMVDMSGSTDGWINEAERESLILLSEALERLGDRYAIYGFSGNTRKRCEIYKIKAFDEPYNDEVRGKISGIRPKDYTRMGAAIRHLNDVLNATEAKTRMLITLSDGKPDDFDGYRGQFGIEDTRRALIESRRSGIHPYCITIDDEAKDYLPHLYGPAAYTVVSEVRQLPLKVSDIYTRLTT